MQLEELGMKLVGATGFELEPVWRRERGKAERGADRRNPERREGPFSTVTPCAQVEAFSGRLSPLPKS